MHGIKLLDFAYQGFASLLSFTAAIMLFPTKTVTVWKTHALKETSRC